MGTLLGQQLSFSLLPPFLIRGQLLKERICSCRSKFFPLTVDPISEGLCHPGKKTRSYKSNLPLQKKKKKQEILEVYPLALRLRSRELIRLGFEDNLFR